MAFLKNRSLRVHILTAFGSVLVIALSITIIYYYRTTSQIVLDSSQDLMDLATAQVMSGTDNFLMQASNMEKMSARLATPEVLRSLLNNDRLERYTIEPLILYPQIEMVYIADDLGNFIMSNREPGGTFATKILERTGAPPKTRWNYRDQYLGVFKSETMKLESFDPRRRPWYLGAKDSKKTYWTDIYIFHTGQKPGITCATPIVDQDGKFLGVLGMDIGIDALSAFLKSLKIGKQGLAFIFSDKGEVVAYPEAGRTVDWAEEDGVLRTVDLENLDVASVTAAYKEYKKTGERRFSLMSGGQRYVASFTPFPPAFEKPWKVGMLAPKDDFTGYLKQANKVALVVSLAILGLAILFASRVSRSISRPILLLTQETEKIKDFRLDEAREISSHIKEIQLLQEGVSRMRVSLKSFTRFAPQEIVREVVVRGQEAMLSGERREVTLLFGDLRSFTGFSENTSPEMVVHLLNAHFEAMVEIINTHGGFVVDFLGDSLFAVFGAPLADAGHARKAVSCAVEMQLVRQRLNEQNEPQGLLSLEMGIGINTGSCVVVNMGSMQRIKYGVVGHAVNLASRLESFTVGGQVLISESTYQAVAPQFELAGPLSAYAKGMEGAIRLWEVRGVAQEKDKSLPPTVPGLIRLAAPLPVLVRLITGKQVSPTPYEGRLVQLSSAGAELQTELPLEIFAPLQIEIPGLAGPGLLIDAKIVGLGGSGDSSIIRFSGLSEAAAAAVNLRLADES
jgi:adenylate cyclase